MGPGTAPALSGPTLSHPAAVHPGDAAAARAHGRYVGHRYAHGEVGYGLGGRLSGRVVFDQADVGAGAAHVEGDEILDARGRGDIVCAGDAGGGAGQGGPDRMIKGGFNGHQAAVRLVDIRREIHAHIADTLFEHGRISADDRAYVAVQRGRAHALVFPIFRQHVARYGDIRLGVTLFYDLGDDLLMDRVYIGVKQTYGIGDDAERFELVHHPFNLFAVDGLQHLAVVEEPFVHLFSETLIDDRHRLIDLNVVKRRPRLPRKLD